MQFIKNFIREDDGQGMVEYGIILGLVAVFAITALTAMGGDVSANSITGEGSRFSFTLPFDGFTGRVSGDTTFTNR